MPGDNGTLDVTLYAFVEEDGDQEGERTIRIEEAESFTDYDYVSLINHGSFGPPALVAPGKGENTPKAKPGDKVLYINTSCSRLAAFDIVRNR